MGGVISYAAGSAKSSYLLGGGDKEVEKADNVDWLNLPCPVKYEEIQREALVSLKPELFEGLRFDFTKPLSQKFSLSHSVFMGSVEVPAQSPQTIKVSASHYEFGANLIDSRMMLIGRILTDGRMTARLKYDVTDAFTVKVNAQLTNEPHFSQGMFHFDYKLLRDPSARHYVHVYQNLTVQNAFNIVLRAGGYVFSVLGRLVQLPSCEALEGKDYQAQVQLGNNAFYGLNYIQSITPTVSLGGEAFWLGHQRKSGVGFAGRFNTDKVIATGQIATTGMVSLTYVQRVSDKVSLASDFMYNWLSKEATTSVGYDYLLRTCRLRGRFDTNGCVAAYLEERLNVGVNFLLSAEIDHWKKDYKFGFGMTVGE